MSGKSHIFKETRAPTIDQSPSLFSLLGHRFEESSKHIKSLKVHLDQRFGAWGLV